MNETNQFEIEHMITNIALWLSHKMSPWFFIFNKNLIISDNTILHLQDSNYFLARTTLVEWLNQKGNIVKIEYNHSEDNYIITVSDKSTEEKQYIIININSTISV